MAIGLKELIGEARRTASELPQKVTVIEGGLSAWAEAGFPTEADS